MGTSLKRFAPAFRRQMVELYRLEQRPREAVEEFGCLGNCYAAGAR